MYYFLVEAKGHWYFILKTPTVPEAYQHRPTKQAMGHGPTTHKRTTHNTC